MEQQILSQLIESIETEYVSICEDIKMARETNPGGLEILRARKDSLNGILKTYYELCFRMK